MWHSSLFGQQSPAALYWRNCAAEEKRHAIADVSNAEPPVQPRTSILNPINSMAIVLRLNLTVLRTMASTDCPFLQDAHRRMASVIARILRAEEREQGERAQDRQCVNGEKCFSSSSSAECTEFEYATKRYSESSPPVGTKTGKGAPPQKRDRDFAPRIQVEHGSSSDEAPTGSRSTIYLWEIHHQRRQVGHNNTL
jgi:hypothetical protein